MQDGSLAYVVARFDRPWEGGKRRQEDFCQLAGKPAKDKYTGSAELCARLIKAYSGQPVVDLLKLMRMLVCAWCTGNGDLHLKNLSLYDEGDGVAKLTPAYDLINTCLYNPHDQLALPLNGRRDKLQRRDWLAFAMYCQLPLAAAKRVLARPTVRLARVETTIARSHLPAEFQRHYAAQYRQRSASLVAG
jgi:serine/threonine-protein kinase HipA